MCFWWMMAQRVEFAELAARRPGRRLPGVPIGPLRGRAAVAPGAILALLVTTGVFPPDAPTDGRRGHGIRRANRVVAARKMAAPKDADMASGPPKYPPSYRRYTEGGGGGPKFR